MAKVIGVIYVRREDAVSLDNGVERCRSWCAAHEVRVIGVVAELAGRGQSRPALADTLLSLGNGHLLVTGSRGELWSDGEEEWRLRVEQAQSSCGFTIAETETSEAMLEEMLHSLHRHAVEQEQPVELFV